MTGYLPQPGEKVLLTVLATVGDDGAYVVRDDLGSIVFSPAPGNSYEVRVEPAPIPVPTARGAVILAEVTDSSIPGRLMLVSGGPYPEDTDRWVHVDRPGDTYSASEITRVHAVLLPGESGG